MPKESFAEKVKQGAPGAGCVPHSKQLESPVDGQKFSTLDQEGAREINRDNSHVDGTIPFPSACLTTNTNMSQIPSTIFVTGLNPFSAAEGECLPSGCSEMLQICS